MSATRQQFLLVSLAYLTFVISPVSAQFGGGNGAPDGNAPGSPNNNGDAAGCAWLTDGAGCNNSSSNGNSTGNMSGSPSSYSMSSGDSNNYDTIIAIHGFLACLVWVILIPLGGILIRSGLKTPALLKIHGFMQSISYLIYAAAAVMGIYLVHQWSSPQHSLWTDASFSPHIRIGLAVLALAFFMPVLGLIHHSMYKKRAAHFKEGGPRPGRTIPGYIHLWLGRVLIVLGMVNGGLGIKLADASPYASSPSKKLIGYAVGCGIIFLIYLIFVIRGELSRSKERRTNRPTGRGFQSVAQEYQPVRAVDHDGPIPPSYEQSQVGLPMANLKTPNTTARYS